MNIAKTLTAGLILTPALVFGIDEDPREQRPTQHQEQLQHQQRDQDRRAGQTQMGRTHAAGQRFVTQVNGNMVSLDSLMGSSARTSDGEDVGNIDDILIDSEGQIKAIVVGVGGFLGIGSKDVAISWDHVSVAPDADNGAATASPDEFVIQVNVTEDQLRDAPEFKRNW
ncbi:MAG: PRC-barrel domain-containing protein [Wenzhouxiangella sp.]